MDLTSFIRLKKTVCVNFNNLAIIVLGTDVITIYILFSEKTTSLKTTIKTKTKTCKNQNFSRKMPEEGVKAI